MSRVATIDIGTVTARLAVVDVEDGRVARCAKQSRICDLGEGVAETGFLSTGAMSRVSSCCEDYLSQAVAAKVDCVCTTLTSAARDASNSGELLGRLCGLGLEPQVIPGRVEGALTFLGVSQDFGGKRIMIADNGGGSTELAVGRLVDGLPRLEYVRSVDVGCRRVTERFLADDDPPTAAALERAHGFCRDLFGRAVPWSPAYDDEGDVALRDVTRPEALIATGGTVTTLVAIDAALDPYDSTYVHLHELGRETVRRLEDEMAQLDLDERSHLIGLQPKRAPVILGGSIAIDELMGQAGFERLTVSESDLLFGVALVEDATIGGRDAGLDWVPALSHVARG